MVITDNTYMVTLISKTGAHYTVLLDVGPAGDSETVQKFVADYKKLNSYIIDHTFRTVGSAKRYSVKRRTDSFEDLYEVVK